MIPIGYQATKSAGKYQSQRMPGGSQGQRHSSGDEPPQDMGACVHDSFVSVLLTHLRLFGLNVSAEGAHV